MEEFVRQSEHPVVCREQDLLGDPVRDPEPGEFEMAPLSATQPEETKSRRLTRADARRDKAEGKNPVYYNLP